MKDAVRSITSLFVALAATATAFGQNADPASVERARKQIEEEKEVILFFAHPTVSHRSFRFDGESQRGGGFALSFTFRWKSFAGEGYSELHFDCTRNGKLEQIRVGDTDALFPPFTASAIVMDVLRDELMKDPSIRDHAAIVGLLNKEPKELLELYLRRDVRELFQLVDALMRGQGKAVPKRSALANPAPLPIVHAAAGDDFNRLHKSATAKYDAKDHRGAIADYTACLALRPNDALVHRNRARAYRDLGDYYREMLDWKRAMALAADDVNSLDGMAWFYATCPEARYRDGAEAVKHATTACEQTNWKDGFYLDTLAAAYAESGEFAYAVRWQEHALADTNLSKRLNSSGMEGARNRLTLYRVNKPYHQAVVAAAYPPAVNNAEAERANQLAAENARLAAELAAARRQAQEAANRPAPVYTPPQPPPAPRYNPPPPSKKSADIIIKSVELMSTKADGSDWDGFGGLPEPKVYICQNTLFGASFTTEKKSDSRYASFNAKSIRVSEGDTIKIIVYDEDVLEDDEAGEYVKTITADTIAQGTVTWTFGRVAALTLEFQR